MIDFYGSTLVGIPVLRAGFNDRLGFVTTNNAPDLDDVFALTADPAKAGSLPVRRPVAAARRRDVSDPGPNSDDGSLRAETRTFWSRTSGP